MTMTNMQASTFENSQIQPFYRNSSYSPGRTTKRCLLTAALTNESLGATHVGCALDGTPLDYALTTAAIRQATSHQPMSQQTKKQPTSSTLPPSAKTTDNWSRGFTASDTSSHHGPTYHPQLIGQPHQASHLRWHHTQHTTCHPITTSLVSFCHHQLLFANIHLSGRRVR